MGKKEIHLYLIYRRWSICVTGVIICKWAFLSLRNEGYIFIRDSTRIRSDMVSGQTEGCMGGLRDGSRNGWIGTSKNGAFFVFYI